MSENGWNYCLEKYVHARNTNFERYWYSERFGKTRAQASCAKQTTLDIRRRIPSPNAPNMALPQGCPSIMLSCGNFPSSTTIRYSKMG